MELPALDLLQRCARSRSAAHHRDGHAAEWLKKPYCVRLPVKRLGLLSARATKQEARAGLCRACHASRFSLTAKCGQPTLSARYWEEWCQTCPERASPPRDPAA